MTDPQPRSGVGAALSASGLSAGPLAVGLATVAVAVIAGLTIGPVDIAAHRVALELLDGLPGITLDSGLSGAHAAIVEDIRLPRVVLGLLVGAILSMSGAAYQGAFRNPLADPYLLGIAAGAGLGATIAITSNLGDGTGVLDPVPLAAFACALVAVAVSYAAGHLGGRSTASLILAGIAVASFLTACQTYVLQANSDAFREIFAWILGRVATSGWSEPALMLPYFVVTVAVVLRYRRALDVLAVGDEEAAALGLEPRRVRMIVVLAASLGRSRGGVGQRPHRLRRHHRAPHRAPRLRCQQPGGAAAVGAVRRGVHGARRPGGPHRAGPGRAAHRRGDRLPRCPVLRAGATDQPPGDLVTAGPGGRPRPGSPAGRRADWETW